MPHNRSAPEATSQNRLNSVTKTVSSSLVANSKQVVINQKADEIKEKMEQELRIQRAEHHKKRTLEMMQQKKGQYKLNFNVNLSPIIRNQKSILINIKNISY